MTVVSAIYFSLETSLTDGKEEASRCFSKYAEWLISNTDRNSKKFRWSKNTWFGCLRGVYIVDDADALAFSIVFPEAQRGQKLNIDI